MSQSEDRAITANNKVERLVSEELPREVEVSVQSWWQPLLQEDLRPGAAGVLHESDARCQLGLRAARAALLPGERDRYRELGVDTAAVPAS